MPLKNAGAHPAEAKAVSTFIMPENPTNMPVIQTILPKFLPSHNAARGL